VGQKLPRKLVICLAVLGVLFLVVSIWLEDRHLDYLQAHPIMVNLMSGLVAFCFGILTVAAGFNWVVEREQRVEASVSLIKLIQEVQWKAFDAIHSLPQEMHGTRPYGVMPTSDPRQLISGHNYAKAYERENFKISENRAAVRRFVDQLQSWSHSDTTTAAMERLGAKSFRYEGLMRELAETLQGLDSALRESEKRIDECNEDDTVKRIDATLSCLYSILSILYTANTKRFRNTHRPTRWFVER